MKGFKHPFSDSLKNIHSRLEELIKLQKIKTVENPKYCILDNADILQLFKITSKTAANWREENILSYCQIKGKIYYRLSDIHEIIDQNYIAIKKKEMK
jgi:hypothetical protein